MVGRRGGPAWDTDPVSQHVLQALSLPDVELTLRREVGAVTDQLAATGSAMVASDRALLETAARRRQQAGPWGLPDGLPPRAVRVIELAGSITSLAEAGLDGRLQAVDSTTTLQRERLLHRLHCHAAAALTAATNLASLHLAGWR